MYDTIIIGGGIAGLQTAIQLGRCLHRVLVVDDGAGRSSMAKNYRNLLGYPDGVSGRQLREAGRIQAEKLGVHFVVSHVTRLVKMGEHRFMVTLEGELEHVEAKTVVLATGICDPVPAIPGLLPCLGESIFICPDCDGYEIVGKRTVIIGTGDQTVEMADVLRYFEHQLIIINHTQTALSSPSLQKLRQWNIPCIEQPVVTVNQKEGKVASVRLKSGEEISCDCGFLSFDGAHINTDLIADLPVVLNEKGHVEVNPRTQETHCQGLWAIGDITIHAQQVTAALGDGSKAAIWIHKRLLEEKKPIGIP